MVREAKRQCHCLGNNKKINCCFLAGEDPSIAYFLDMEIGGRKLRPLLDTGAAQSFIRLECVNSNNIRPVDVKAVGPKGETVHIVGKTRMSLKMDNFQTKHDFLVVEGLHEQGLIGADFVDRHIRAIDPQNRTIKIGKQRIPMIVQRGLASSSSDIPWRALRLSSKIKVKPWSKCNIECDVCAPVGRLGIVKGGLFKAPSNNDCFIAHTVTKVNKNGRVIVPLINPSNAVLTIKAGTLFPYLDIADCSVDKRKSIPINRARVVNNKAQNGTIPTEIDCPPVELGNSELDDKQKEEVRGLLVKYAEVFAKDKNDFGCYKGFKHKIIVSGKPKKQPIRRATMEEKQVIKQEVDRMLEADIIEPSTSPWSSPIVLVRKKDGDTRFCVDYRYVNSVTEKDAYPLPRIDDTLETLGGAKWFSTFDLQAGFNQLEIEEESRPVTSFATLWGSYQYKRLPFGLSNGPASMQLVIQTIFSGMLFEEVLCYLDDVIIFSKTYEDHVKSLEKTLRRFLDSGLKVKPSKTHIACKKVEYLGFIVSAKGVEVDPEKTKAVEELPIPRNPTEVRQILGLFSYYRKWIKNFSAIAEPLTRLTRTKNEKKFEWGPSQQEAFDTLKEKLLSPPILGFPVFDRPFRIYTDASNTGIGAVLAQVQENEQGGEIERTIAYISRQLSDAERKQGTSERELLGACWAVSKFRPYLRSRFNNGKVEIITDHNPLATLRVVKDHGGKMGRYKMLLQEYDIDWYYKPGKNHTNADALSRVPDLRTSEEIVKIDKANDDYMDIPFNNLGVTNSKTLLRKLLRMMALDVKPKRQTALQQQPNILKDVPNQLSRESIRECQANDPAVQEKKKQSRKRGTKDFIIEDDILFRKTSGKTFNKQFWLPEPLRRVAMSHIHEVSGHLAHDKTFSNLKARFYWPGYEKDVEAFVAGCLSCQKRNAPPTAFAPMLSLKSDYPNDLVMWDMTGPVTRTVHGNNWMLVIIDGFTRFAEVYPLPDEQARSVADCLIHYALHYGSPRQLHSDRGKNFMAEVVKLVSNVLGTKQSHTSGYVPWANGGVERFNRTLKSMLAKVIDSNQSDWDKHLLPVVYAYNTTIQDSTGFSPFFLQFGRAPQLPVDVLLENPPRVVDKMEYVIKLRRSLQEAFKSARNMSAKMRKQNKTLKESNHNVAEEFNIGQLVMLHNPATPKGKSRKLMCQYYGPYTILSRAGPVNYMIRLFDGSSLPKLVHRNRLKLVKGDEIVEQYKIHEGPANEELRPLDTDAVEERDVETDQIQGTEGNSNEESVEQLRDFHIPLIDIFERRSFPEGVTTFKRQDFQTDRLLEEENKTPTGTESRTVDIEDDNLEGGEGETFEDTPHNSPQGRNNLIIEAAEDYGSNVRNVTFEDEPNISLTEYPTISVNDRNMTFVENQSEHGDIREHDEPEGLTTDRESMDQDIPESDAEAESMQTGEQLQGLEGAQIGVDNPSPIALRNKGDWKLVRENKSMVTYSRLRSGSKQNETK